MYKINAGKWRSLQLGDPALKERMVSVYREDNWTNQADWPLIQLSRGRDSWLMPPFDGMPMPPVAVMREVNKQINAEPGG